MHLSEIAGRLKNEIIKLIDKGYETYFAGGALGFDTLAAQTVLDLKQQYPQIKLILALPCISQTRNWSEKDCLIYEYIKQRADKVVYISEEYTLGCMHKRNRYLADNSNICICYLTKTTGGTAYTVNYSRKKGLEIINIA